MKVALVHDYLGEFGGAERVLLALSEIWPDAPIYTAFYRKGSAWERFKDKNIKVSWAHHIPGFSTKLHSPLRFLAPLIWKSFDFSKYDLVVSSASWYVTKGFAIRPSTIRYGAGKTQNARRRTIEICYCHTPPRYLYGYETSVNWAKYWPVKIYAAIVGHFMRLYDWNSAQRVDYFIANSQEVKKRIEKFYRREATVIYPPVEVPRNQGTKKLKNKIKDYYLVVSRIVGGKGLEMAVEAANRIGFPLKVVGAPAGYVSLYNNLQKKAKKNVQFLGHVRDEQLSVLYSGARAFLALAKDEDFGITPVEAMLSGTPVIAFRGGGYIETVVDPSTARSGQGATGLFFNDYNIEDLTRAIKKFEKTRINPEDCIKQGKKFSKGRFKKEILKFVNSKTKGQL